MTRSPRRRGLRMAVFAAALGLLLAACNGGTRYNTLEPAGPVAAKQAGLFWLVFWIGTAVFVLVEGALLYVLWKYRRRSADDAPEQVHGNTRLEVIWTIIPALLLAGVAVPTVGALFDLSEAPDGAMEIDVIGHQWWWEISYPGLGVTTANEVHIPTGEQVVFNVTSDDVIHSWWVPRLAGKIDMVPGRTNTINMAADRPGTYYGECAEFCGLSHGNMKFRVIAHTPEEFQTWVETEKAEAAAPEAGSVAEQTLPTCFACHVINGVGGPQGPPAAEAPDLSHFGRRQSLAGGMLENTPEQLARWLENPPAVKAGSKMPDYNLTEDQIEALVEYLRSLR